VKNALDKREKLTVRKGGGRKQKRVTRRIYAERCRFLKKTEAKERATRKGGGRLRQTIQEDRPAVLSFQMCRLALSWKKTLAALDSNENLFSRQDRKSDLVRQ